MFHTQIKILKKVPFLHCLLPNTVKLSYKSTLLYFTNFLCERVLSCILRNIKYNYILTFRQCGPIQQFSEQTPFFKSFYRTYSLGNICIFLGTKSAKKLNNAFRVKSPFDVYQDQNPTPRINRICYRIQILPNFVLIK